MCHQNLAMQPSFLVGHTSGGVEVGGVWPQPEKTDSWSWVSVWSIVSRLLAVGHQSRRPPGVPAWHWITGDDAACGAGPTESETSGAGDACIQPSDGNDGPSVTVRGAIHHGGRCELVVLDGTLNCQHFIMIIHDSRLLGRQAFLNETLCISRAIPRPTKLVTRLLFWHHRMRRSWTGQLRVQAWTSLSMFGAKLGEGGSETLMSSIPLCQNCGMLSSRRELQFAQEGWGPGWRACYVVCSLLT